MDGWVFPCSQLLYVPCNHVYRFAYFAKFQKIYIEIRIFIEYWMYDCIWRINIQ